MAIKKDDEGQIIGEGEPLFRLYMQSRLPNPHYIPEIQAQTTLVNFTVTEKGLEDQLLSTVVGHERPDLLQEQSELVEMQNGFTIKLKELGDNLLFLLATAEGDIPQTRPDPHARGDQGTVKEINAKEVVAAGRSRSRRRSSLPAERNRGSLIYFLMNKMNVVDHMYQYSLARSPHLLKARPRPRVRVVASACRADRVDHVHALRFVSSGLFERTASPSRPARDPDRPQAGPLQALELDLLVSRRATRPRRTRSSRGCPTRTGASSRSRSHEEFANLPTDLEAREAVEGGRAPVAGD